MIQAPSSDSWVTTPEPPKLAPRPSRIVIARLGIDLALAEGGDEDNVPNGVALHWPGTPWPCEPGHSYVYGHARRGVFLALWGIQIGDVIDFGDCQYIVDSITRVSSSDTTVITETTVYTVYTLSVQTSTGPNRDYPEFIVHSLIARDNERHVSISQKQGVPDLIRAAALEFGQDPERMARVAFCESSLNPRAVGGHGEMGLWQFKAATWAANAAKLGYGPDGVWEPLASSRVAAEMWSRLQQWQWTCYDLTR